MRADVDIIVLPYASADGNSLLHLLIEELESKRWTHFRAAVAFARQSGNYQELIQAMLYFAESGGVIELTFGANYLGKNAAVTEYYALKDILNSLGDKPSVKLYLYHESNRTFHPKIYLFSNETDSIAATYIGSSNWSAGGFHDNVEINVKIGMDLTKPDNKRYYDYLNQIFSNFWKDL